MFLYSINSFKFVHPAPMHIWTRPGVPGAHSGEGSAGWRRDGSEVSVEESEVTGDNFIITDG